MNMGLSLLVLLQMCLKIVLAKKSLVENTVQNPVKKLLQKSKGSDSIDIN